MVHRKQIEKILKTMDYCVYWGIRLNGENKKISWFEPFVETSDNLFASCEECKKIKGNRFFMTLKSARNYIEQKKTSFNKKCFECGKHYKPIRMEKMCHQCRHKDETVFQELNIKTTIITEVKWTRK